MGESTEAVTPLDLSLYRLETGLADLIEYRQYRLADTDNRPTEEEIAALDAEIQRYELATPAKVSAVAAVVRNWKAKRETAATEIKRLQQIIAHYECVEARLKDYLKAVLEVLPEPKRGARKLTGADGSTITLKGNGGLAPLRIQDDVLPDEYRDATVTMPLEVFQYLQDNKAAWGEVLTATIAPANRRIREALSNGRTVPGAWLEDRGQHVEVR